MRRNRTLRGAFSLGLVLALLAGLNLILTASPGWAQVQDMSAAAGTAFTYQGQLKDAGGPVNAVCDLQFTLWDALEDGAQLGSAVLLEGVLLQDGLFTARLDFGPAAFQGQARWLEIAVSCPAGSGFVTLAPRQALTGSPYALWALSAPWTGLEGVPADLLDGDQDTTYTAGAGLVLEGAEFRVNRAEVQWRVSQTCAVGSSIREIGVDGTVVCEADTDTTYTPGVGLSLNNGQFSVDFAGGGTAATASRSDHHHDAAYVNEGQANSVSTGMVQNSTLRLEDLNQNGCGPGQVIKWNGSAWACAGDETGGNSFWSLTGNAATMPGTNYLGTSDNTALVLKVNNTRALRIEPSSETPNLIGGWWENYVTAGVVGATICGGGSGEYGENRVTDMFGTVGGGVFNQAGDDTTEDFFYPTVSGGYRNTATKSWSTVGGGGNNTASHTYSTVSGGDFNSASGYISTVGGGSNNTASGGVSTVSGGGNNTASYYCATVGGGRENLASNWDSTIAGGFGNTASGDVATVGGGQANSASNQYTTVGGGYDNNASGEGAAVGGGQANSASAGYATVGGGSGNDASGEGAAVGGGSGNDASGYGSTVGGGGGNQAMGLGAVVAGGIGMCEGTDSNNVATGGINTIGGGACNLTDGSGATIAGGSYNSANADYATVGGGQGNTASAIDATVGGGQGNTASAIDATVGGGADNIASDDSGTVAGGFHNQAGDNAGTPNDRSFATVGGGRDNVASGIDATVGGGRGNTASGNGAVIAGGGSGTYNQSIASGVYSAIGGGQWNTASGDLATVAGGYHHRATGWMSTVGGGSNNEASEQAATVGGGMTNLASGAQAVVGGGADNTASGLRSTVGGGWDNSSSGEHATVGGGESHIASDDWGTVAGGYNNLAGNNTGSTEDRPYATVGGGRDNIASGTSAVVAGGDTNTASGNRSTVPGGVGNVAAGHHSFAAGRQAKALHDGSFVWADSHQEDFSSDAANEFLVRAYNGVKIVRGASTYSASQSALQVDQAAAAEAGWFYTMNTSNPYTVLKVAKDPAAPSTFIDGVDRTSGGAETRRFHIDKNGTYTAGSDFAESLPVAGDPAGYEPGDVLVISLDRPGGVEKCQQPYDGLVVGVYSTRPGFLGADKGGATEVAADEVPVAVLGIVPVKVTDENGAIRPGDLLTTSSTAGHAMRCAGLELCFGRTLGKALEGLPAGQSTGVIQVLVSLQ